MSEKELAEIENRWSSMGFSPGIAHLTTDIPCLIAEVRRLKEDLLQMARDCSGLQVVLLSVSKSRNLEEALARTRAALGLMESPLNAEWNAAIEAAAKVVDTAGYKLCLDVNVPSGLGLTPIGQTLLDVKALKRPAEGGSDV